LNGCGAAGLCARVRACAGAAESLHTYIYMPRARSLSPVGLVGGYVMAANVSGKPADWSSGRARGVQPLGDLLASVRTDRLCAHDKGRGDELERLRSPPIGLSAGRLCVFWRDQPCISRNKQKACSCTSSTTGAAYAASGAWRA